MSGFQTNMMAGFAQLIDDGHLGTYRATGAYEETETGIMLRKVPQAPAGLITLSTYGISDDVWLPNAVVGLQVRSRGWGEDPRLADDLNDAIFDLLQGYTGTLSTGVHVTKCRRASGPTSLGKDGNGHWSVASNYAITAFWPSAHRI